MNWHTETMAEMKTKNIDELRYIKQDCLEAAIAGERLWAIQR